MAPKLEHDDELRLGPRRLPPRILYGSRWPFTPSQKVFQNPSSALAAPAIGVMPDFMMSRPLGSQLSVSLSVISVGFFMTLMMHS